MDVSRIHLVVFLSRATPLRAWDESGILDREIALYKRLRERLRCVSIVTSGGPEELDYQDRVGDIRILCNHKRISPNLYSLRAPSIHSDSLSDADVFKSNQMDGAWTAVLASRRHRKPVVVRAGYLWARHFELQSGKRVKGMFLRLFEAYSLKGATRIVLTTEAMKRFYADSYRLSEKKITVIPNYVDTVRFRPNPAIEKTPGRVCYIGRVTERKNIHLLIESAAGIEDCCLVLIGQGEEESDLRHLAAERGVDVEFTGALPHAELPAQINRSEVFVLVSQFEGHPKSLIEAMGCGAAVLGTNVDGIREVIRDGETGLLCEPTIAGIRGALQRLLVDADLRKKLGSAAAKFVLQEYSLDKIVERERAVYEAICTEK